MALLSKWKLIKKLIKVWDAVIPQCPQINCDLAKPPLNLGHRWAIKYTKKQTKKTANATAYLCINRNLYQEKGSKMVFASIGITYIHVYIYIYILFCVFYIVEKGIPCSKSGTSWSSYLTATVDLNFLTCLIPWMKPFCNFYTRK